MQESNQYKTSSPTNRNKMD